MDESRHRLWDVALKIGAAVAGIASFLYGVHQFGQEQRAAADAESRAEVRARERAFVTELFHRDLEVFSSIAEAASRVAVATDDPSAFGAAARDYEQLYWGNVTVEDSPDVARSMDALRNAIRHYRDGLTAEGDAEPSDQLKRAAHQVSLATRRAVRGRFETLKRLDPTVDS